MDVKGRTALVTGAGRGLGEALARRLARQGAKVVLVARDGSAIDRVAREIGGNAFAVPGDVGDPEAAARIVGAATAVAGPIDLLVHNASVLGPVPLRLLADTSAEDFSRVLEVNVAGPFRLTRLVLGSMLLRRTGVIVHVSSDAAVEPYPRWGAYAASKAALDQLNRVLGAELEGTGVMAFSVDPGEMRTRMHADAIPEADPSTLSDPSDVADAIADLVAGAGTLGNGSRHVARVAVAR